MSNRKIVSEAVIRRLPRYLRYLEDLNKNEALRVSSKVLSEKMNLTASQIRQDLSCFGEFGQQGYGYNVKYLHEEIKKIIGTNKGYNLIVIGAGNMGRAIINSESIKKRGFNVVKIFDIKDKLVGTKINDIEILHFEQLEDYLKDNKIDIVALTVPNCKTYMVIEKLVRGGVKGLWNFTSTEVILPKDILVENVHLSDSIMILGYKINNN